MTPGGELTGIMNGKDKAVNPLVKLYIRITLLVLMLGLSLISSSLFHILAISREPFIYVGF
ncbi:MAG: hypothetical protein CVU49_08205 [Candidatus Cloacimonetes bacterium HGW-Cloacimonetes-2]|jgi:hypothetical protein|nr:MAG: hypothetical protein CVU49_08205 [Candidatus Cloacimonetes bacterium HGW-Cloacimonetes-2]